MKSMPVPRKTLAVSFVLAIILAGTAAAFAVMLGGSASQPLTPQAAAPVDALVAAPVSSRADSPVVLASRAPVVSDATMAGLLSFRDTFLRQSFTIEPGYLQRALADGLDGVNGLKGGSLGDFQRSVISDGVLTLNEYEQAQDLYRGCMVAKGYSVAPLALTTLGRYLPTVGIELVNGIEQGEADEASCQAQYNGIIDIIWANVTGPVQDRVAEVQGAAMATCLSGVQSSEAYGPARSACMQSITKATKTFVYLAG